MLCLTLSAMPCGSRWAPPCGSFRTSSTRPSFLSRSAVPPMASAAISFFSVLFHKMEAQLFGRKNEKVADRQQDQPVAHADGERAARAAFADDHAQHRRGQIRHFE